ncbi:MAG TPA: efflux RND transporter periplasmic adaptor subunit [Steroidobacteraceae bacterium]|nr:efflux RND transporter periplasmic adaptor subunit [Steroidobacteraceae bacterium]
MDKAELLQQLRIDRGQKVDHGDRGRTRWLAGAALAVLILASAGAYLLLRGKPFAVQAATAAAPSVNPGPTAILQATGYVTARRQATVSAQITGTLTQVLIEEGEHVKAGQVLARLEDTAQRAALGQAEAQLEAAKALAVQIEAQLGQARRDLVRSQDLVGRKLVSQQAVETAQTQVDSLAAQLDSQQRDVDLARAGVRGAQVQLDYTTVRAPFAGVVIAKAAQTGEIISPISAGGGFTRTGVGTIVDMDSLEIEVDVNEAYINRVQPAQPAQAVLDAYPSWTIPAHVIAIVPTADRSKATVKVRIGIDQKDSRILPDMGVRVSFLEEPSKEAAPSPGTSAVPTSSVLVPSSAIVSRAGHSVVFVIEGDHARLAPVTPGQTYGDLRGVEGIAAGTRVVREPPGEMNDGARVSVGAK